MKAFIRKEVFQMNHLKQIAAKLDKYGLDGMLIMSDPGGILCHRLPRRGRCGGDQSREPLFYRFPLH